MRMTITLPLAPSSELFLPPRCHTALCTFCTQLCVCFCVSRVSISSKGRAVRRRSGDCGVVFHVFGNMRGVL